MTIYTTVRGGHDSIGTYTMSILRMCHAVNGGVGELRGGRGMFETIT